MPDNTLSTLSNIVTKVRYLTRSPSENQLPVAQIKDYVNNFVLYDFPLRLRTFSLKKNLTFYTQPYVDIYQENTINTNDPLYNFKNEYISIKPPVYVSGQEIFFTQSEDQFYRLYPKITNQVQVSTGDGITTSFSGTITGVPVYRNTVIISSLDSSNLGLTAVDYPLFDAITGNPKDNGFLVNPANITSILGTINYITGVYTLNFITAPAAAQPVYLQAVQYAVNVPQAMLYFDSKFVIRPVPDKAYAIQLDVMQRPSELMSNSEMPEFSELWQYIAYGAAKKVFEDRMDPESVQIIMPEFSKQETLCLSRTYDQQKNERSSTIYTDQTEALTSGWGRGGWF
jgi:hypothetical protein